MENEPAALSHNLRTAFALLIDALPRHGAVHALVGGLAAGLRGRFRFTDDIDFIVNVPQVRLPLLLDELIVQGFQLDTIAVIREWNDHHFVAFDFKDVRIDWVKPLVPAYQHVLDHATEEDWQGRKFRLASAEGLILMKLIPSREQDLADIVNLLAANRDQLALDWIEREWCTLFDTVDPRWIRFQQAIGEYYRYPRVSS